MWVSSSGGAGGTEGELHTPSRWFGYVDTFFTSFNPARFHRGVPFLAPWPCPAHATHMVTLATRWRVLPCAQLPENVSQSREKVHLRERRCTPPTRADADKPDDHLDLWFARLRSAGCTQTVLHPPCACFGRLASTPLASARSICVRPTCIRRALERRSGLTSGLYVCGKKVLW